MTRDYLALLDRYSVGWMELRTSTPGRVTHEDIVHVIAVPSLMSSTGRSDSPTAATLTAPRKGRVLVPAYRACRLTVGLRDQPSWSALLGIDP